MKQLFTVTLSVFYNIRVTIEGRIAEEDKVVSRFRAQGTHTGEFVGIAPNGNEANLMQIGIDHFSGEKIGEHWGLADQMTLIQQLGFVSPTG